jgi:3-hydroxyacyl-[acyl-carrier-protein] dehydratase
VTVAVAIPADGPLFEGHFPGRPILPGIAELVLVAAALAPSGDASEVCAIPFARFRELVLPADLLELTATPRGEGSVRFDARRAGTLVANGALTFGVPGPCEPHVAAVASREVRGAPPIRDWLPHRPPMLFVERLLGEAEDGVTCVGRIPAGCAMVTRGSAPAFVALELAAQCAAVWEALARSRLSGPASARNGYLVSLKDVVLHRSTVPADGDLIASVRLSASAPPLSTYTVDVVAEGERVLFGTIGTYLSD